MSGRKQGGTRDRIATLGDLFSTLGASCERSAGRGRGRSSGGEKFGREVWEEVATGVLGAGGGKAGAEVEARAGGGGEKWLALILALSFESLVLSTSHASGRGTPSAEESL